MSKSAACPWTKLTDVKSVEIGPLVAPVNIEVALPGSKSVSNRVLLMAALADAPCRLSGVLRSDDTYWMTESLKTLGANIAIDGSNFSIWGNNLLASRSPTRIFVGSSGTAARFLPGVLAARQAETIMAGSEQLTKRPIASLVEGLKSLGAAIETMGEGERLPLKISGGGFDGGQIAMSGAQSSQFISGVLIAAPLSRQGVTLEVPDEIVQSDYVRITLHYMKAFGVVSETNNDLTRFFVPPQQYRAANFPLEADASTATYFFALAALTGGRTKIANLGTTTTQPDYGFVDILERMGCRVVKTETTTEVVGGHPLKGGFDIDMKPLSDATLTLAAIAPFADGPIHIHNVAHIRHHESDRIKVACDILTGMGLRVEERPDGLSIYPGNPRKTEIDPRDDHRVAMSMALTGAKGNGIVIDTPSCVSKTCPEFFDLLSACAGVSVTPKMAS
ncbi:MAG: 3-phosphoshikimate 1-carboxyvinyltransferase [Bdellovibrionales bacterium]